MKITADSNMAFAILPSLLAANSLYLGETLEQLSGAKIDTVHLDVMDNHYVPNLSFSPQVCQHLHQQFPQLKIDVHLMANPVDELIHQFAKAGAYRISIHPETTHHLHRSLALIKSYGCLAGIALNPVTSPDVLAWCDYMIDFVLIMTVNPGFGGQSFIKETLPKITAIRQRFPNLNIAVDGGITEDNIGLVTQAGANHFVVGSAIFSHNDYKKTIANLDNLVHLSHQKKP